MRKWSRRKNGRTMTTVMLPVHIDQHMVDWISKAVQKKPESVIEFLRKNLETQANQYLDWHVPAVLGEELEFCHVDEIHNRSAEGWETYDH